MAEERASFMRRVYTWMTGGVLLTALVSTYLGSNPEMMISLMRTPVLFYGLMFAQLGMVIALSAAIDRLSVRHRDPSLRGLRGSDGRHAFDDFHDLHARQHRERFLHHRLRLRRLESDWFYDEERSWSLGCLLWNGSFRHDRVGNSFFLLSLDDGGNASFVYSAIGVFVFAGLTAYDTQKIKNMAFGGSTGFEAAEIESKAAIMGALMLYLDFINLFLSLLRLMGDRRR